MGLQRVRHDWATELNWGADKWPSLQFLQFAQSCGVDNKTRNKNSGPFPPTPERHLPPYQTLRCFCMCGISVCWITNEIRCLVPSPCRAHSAIYVLRKRAEAVDRDPRAIPTSPLVTCSGHWPHPHRVSWGLDLWGSTEAQRRASFPENVKSSKTAWGPVSLKMSNPGKLLEIICEVVMSTQMQGSLIKKMKIYLGIQ